MWTDAKVLEAAEYFERLEQARAARLNELDSDKVFNLETGRIKDSLVPLLKTHPDAMKAFFRGFSYTMLYRPGKVRRILRGIKNKDVLAGIQEYLRYASRFQVRLALRGSSFRVLPIVPMKAKYRARIDQNFLEPSSQAAQDETEPVFEDLFADDDLQVVKQVSDYLAKYPAARYVELDDKAGGSLLSALESFAYSPESLTFMIHHAPHQEYLFCLVGERVGTDSTWKAAGKVVTALQKQLYGRSKAGRPSDVQRLKKAIQLRQPDPRPFKERAYELLPKDNYDVPLPGAKLPAQQQYLSRVERRIRPREKDARKVKDPKVGRK